MLLVHDESLRPFYSIVGLRIPGSGEKVRIHTVAAEGVWIDHPDAPIEYETEHVRQKHETGMERTRTECREARAQVDAYVAKGCAEVTREGRVTCARSAERRGRDMGYGTDGLTFRTLRAANLQRLPLFKDAKGRTCHGEKDGPDWSPAQWLQAVVGELGEYANLRKKCERGDLTPEEAKPMLADELADVVIYLDILAAQLGIDLGEAVMHKWNKTSEKVGAPIRIDAEDWHYTKPMPTTPASHVDPPYRHEYHCVECGHDWEAVSVLTGPHPDRCPQCGKQRAFNPATDNA